MARQQRMWLDGAGTWPLVRGLEPPTANDIRTSLRMVTQWTSAWGQERVPDGARVVRETYLMRGMGHQTMPVRIEFDSPRAVAAFVGKSGPWDRVVARRTAIAKRWPQLASGAGIGPLYDWLAAASDADFDRLIDVATWLLAHPRSGLYLRQLPVVGVDTKWIEGGQRRAIATLVGLLHGELNASGETEKDFLRLCGLRGPDPRIRIMVLDPNLRQIFGGLRDLQAPLSELATLAWEPRATLLLENLACAHSLPDLASTVAIVGLGRAVSLAAQMPWIHSSCVFYWGDIDTDGLEILATARGLFPGLQSLLMDRDTLVRYRDRWVAEGRPNTLANRGELSQEECRLYEALLANKWEDWPGTQGVRLEQERLDWPHVESTLRQAVANPK
ncbi:MAG: hypothetical protein JSS56_17195 [Proteobacteria bacterium]|nr:hypothetical protein [Pseudomonadota bacterium]